MEQTVISSKNQIETLVRGWIDGLVFAHEVRLAQTGGFDFLENNEVASLGKEEARDLESLLRFAGGIHNDSQKKAVDQVLSGMRDPDEFEPVIQSAARAMKLPLDRSTVQGSLSARYILRGYATLLDELRETRAAIPKHVAEPVAATPWFVFLKFWDDFEKHKRGT